MSTILCQDYFPESNDFNNGIWLFPSRTKQETFAGFWFSAMLRFVAEMTDLDLSKGSGVFNFQACGTPAITTEVEGTTFIWNVRICQIRHTV